MSLNDKITVTWLTEDKWKGTKYTTKRKFITPADPQSLDIGENVSVKFNRNWYPACVVTPWVKQSKRKISILVTYLCGMLRGRQVRDKNVTGKSSIRTSRN